MGFFSGGPIVQLLAATNPAVAAMYASQQELVEAREALTDAYRDALRRGDTKFIRRVLGGSQAGYSRVVDRGGNRYTYYDEQGRMFHRYHRSRGRLALRATYKAARKVARAVGTIALPYVAGFWIGRLTWFASLPVKLSVAGGLYGSAILTGNPFLHRLSRGFGLGFGSRALQRTPLNQWIRDKAGTLWAGRRVLKEETGIDIFQFAA